MESEAKIITLYLSQEMYEQVEEFADLMEVSESEVIQEALKQYIAYGKRWQQIRKRGEETAKKFGVKNEDDVDRLIHEFRREKSKCRK